MLQAQIEQFNIPLFVSIGSAIIIFFVFFFYLLIIQFHKRRIIHQKEMLDLRTQYEQITLQSQLEIQEQTFRNISQEIHDNIGQVLSLAKLNLNTIPSNALTEKIAITEELLGKAINDLRDLSKSLYTEKITDIGLCQAIMHELTIIERTTQMYTTFEFETTELPLSNEKLIIVFRMIQEILHNIIKHSKATEIKVTIKSEAENELISVSDNGKGFDLNGLNNNETGIGIKSIKQRCKLINADFNIYTAPGKGTNVVISINNSPGIL